MNEMPPHKKVPTLEELSISSIVSLVQASCKKMEELFPATSASTLSYDSIQCKAAVLRMQEHLRQYIAPLLWEEIFYQILDQLHAVRTVDKRILLAVFLFDKVRILTLKIPDMSNYTPYIMHHRIQDFWINCFRMLPNLVEVHFEPYAFGCDAIIREVCETCSNLEVLNLPEETSTETVKFVVNSCKNLRKFQLNCESYQNFRIRLLVKLAIEQLEHLEQIECEVWDIRLRCVFLASINRKLKLTKFQLDLLKPEDITLVAERCPDLMEFNIGLGGPNIDSSKIFQNLSSSLLKVSKLSLSNVSINDEDFEKFICAKGIYITELDIGVAGIISGTPQDLLEVISKCNNLTKLKLDFLRWSQEHSSIPARAKQISFPKLQYLDIFLCNNVEALVGICLDNAVNLMSPEMIVIGIEDVDFEQSLFQLFNKQQAKKLKYFQLITDIVITSNLARHFVESCPELTHLDISTTRGLSEESAAYFKQLKEEVTTKNLDLTLSMT